jgi:SAM-dependent methyltransferase
MLRAKRAPLSSINRRLDPGSSLDLTGDDDLVPRILPDRFCCDDDLALIGYDGRFAATELEQLRRSGPRRTTQELIAAVVAEGVKDASVIDIGAGVGAVHTALLDAGALTAIDVDASRDFLAAARDEAERRKLGDRVEYRYGDVVELAPDLPAADIVTLDSVICCYPSLPALLNAALAPNPRLVGLTYPRDVWWMIAWMHAFNFAHALRRSRARYFIYHRADIQALMAARGYQEAYDGGSSGWRVVLFRRA